MEDIIIAERRRADAIAQEYINKGYEVSREVPLDFFHGFRADIVVRKGDEVKVVEVKSRTSLARHPEITELANLLLSKPGWTYELNLVGERERLASPETARPLARADIPGRIEEAERQVGLGFPDAALLIAWSTAEAAVRILIEEDGISIKRITNPAYTIGLAVSEGVIPREDYDYLTEVMMQRNAIIHGFKVEINDELVATLIENTQRLLLEAATVQTE